MAVKLFDSTEGTISGFRRIAHGIASAGSRAWNTFYDLKAWLITEGFLTDSVSIEYYPSLLDAMKPISIINLEGEGIADGTSLTHWTISSVDTVGKTITLDNPIPFEISESPYWCAFYGHTDAVRIVDVDPSTNTLTYDNLVGADPVATDRVCFYNAFRNWELVQDAPVIDKLVDGLADTYHSADSMWKASDGTYRAAIILVFDSSGNPTTQIMSSPDMINWTPLGDPVHFGTAPYDSFPATHADSAGGFRMQKLPNSDNYLCSVGARDYSPTTTRALYVFVADEDARPIDNNYFVKSTSGVTIDGNLSDLINVEVSYLDGYYHVTANHDNTTGEQYRRMLYYKVRRLDELDWESPTTKISNEPPYATDDYSFYAGKNIIAGHLIYNNELYIALSGEHATYTESPFYGNKETGFMHINKVTGQMEALPQGPFLGNPIEGDDLYNNSELLWCRDHAQGQARFMDNGDGYLYTLYTMNNGTDQYQTGLYRLKIQK